MVLSYWKVYTENLCFIPDLPVDFGILIKCTKLSEVEITRFSLPLLSNEDFAAINNEIVIVRGHSRKLVTAFCIFFIIHLTK